MLKSILTALFLSTATVTSAQTIVLISDISDSMMTSTLDMQFQSYYNLISNPTFYSRMEHHQIEIFVFGDGAQRVYSGSIDGALETYKALSTREGRKALVTIKGYFSCVTQSLLAVESIADNFEYPVVVDINSNGAENCRVTDLGVSKRLFTRGITVNSLPMGNENSETYRFFEEHITTGFTQKTLSEKDFQSSLYKKLDSELAILEQMNGG